MADGDSLFAIATRRFFRDRAAIAGIVGVLLLLIPALYAPFIANGRPLLGHVLEALSFLRPEDIVLVVGYKKEQVLAVLTEYYRGKKHILVSDPKYIKKTKRWNGKGRKFRLFFYRKWVRFWHLVKRVFEKIFKRKK